MKARAMAALWAGKLTAGLSRGLRRGGGTTLPGDVSRWVDPRILTTLSRSLDQGAAVVTGTNGKTTTAALLRHILEAQGRRTVANQAGANSVGGLSFGLIDPEPLVEQALSQATKRALAHAGAIAAGLGGKAGTVLSAQEGVSYTPLPVTGAGVATAATTPVQTGTVTVYASVTINVQLQ